MKNWLRNWLFNQNRGLSQLGNPMPMVAGPSPRTFTLGVTEAQNGWVVNYTRYDHNTGQEHSATRVTTDLTGVTDEVTTLLALHALSK